MGYRGDVFPFVPIASALVRRGHEVVFVVPREFHDLFSAEPFRCVHSGTDFGPKLLDQYGAYVARWGKRLGGLMLMRLYFGRLTIPEFDRLFEAVDQQLAEADLLVSHPASSMVASMSCERRGLPWVVGDLFPTLVPTVHAPPAGFPNLGTRANALLWRMSRSRVLDPVSSGAAFRAQRKRLGLDSEGWNVMDGRLSPYLNLGLVSRHYAKEQADWPTNYRLTGFTDWVGPGQGQLPQPVIEFLDSGEPPLIVTMGTSAASACPGMFARVARVLDRLGSRGLFLTSNDDIANGLRAEVGSVRHGIWPFAPLLPLLPRSCGIVHSGSHGSNAMALSAGVPSVILPGLFDQQWHAQRQQQLGTGIWVKSPRRLEAAVRLIIADREITARARALGRLIVEENGIHNAADAIETVLPGVE